MCGISVIINTQNSEITKDEIEKMNDKIIHRGPDSEGYFFGPGFAFGHRRLSIIDVSISGHQPMGYTDKYWITYNGEIYNYLEIKQELLEKGYQFQNQTDTEVIMAAYDFWGFDCVQKFNGMWAFVIYDIQKNQLFIARDRFGIKPLYYRHTKNSVQFGSEIKQLLSDDKQNEVNEHILIEFMLTHFENHSNETFFKDIFNFPASHYATYDLKNHDLKFEKFYTLKINHDIRKKTEAEQVEEFERLLKDSVLLRLRSDVKVGTCLSGGLDSSTVSTIGASHYKPNDKTKFFAVHAQSEDISNDESKFAYHVSESSNLDIQVTKPTYQDFAMQLDEVVYTQEEPFTSPSMFMGWHVFQKARQEKCPVMLNGQGGDEILMGYERYYTSTLSFRKPLKSISTIYKQFKNNRQSLLETIQYCAYFRSYNLRKNRLLLKSYLKKMYKNEKYLTNLKESAISFNNSDTLSLLEITKIQLPHLLRYEDRSSMRHSIETRLPFLDYRLVEFCVSLPDEMKMQNGWMKYILRQVAQKYIPESVAWRKNKFGFEAPDKIWLTKHHDQMLDDIRESKLLNKYCEHDTLIKNYDKLSLKDKWMYFVIARWERVYKVSIPTL